MDFLEMDQIAFFDLDNTLTKRDTLVPFLLGLMFRNPWSCIVTPILVFSVCQYYLGQIDNHTLKRRFVYWIFLLSSQRSIERWSRRFAQRVWSSCLYDEARKALSLHREKGKVVLVTASIECYVLPLADLLKVDKVICTRLMRDKKNRYTGRLLGENCYGDEKVIRIKSELAECRANHTFFYSDHHSDLPVLDMADTAFAVNPTKKLLAIAAEKGFEILYWR